MSPTFFDDFYLTFGASSPVVREKLKNTDMAAQKALLRGGIAYMIMFAGGSAHAANKVRELGKSHSKTKYDIAPNLYPFWVSSLLSNVAKHDPQYTPALGEAWRRVVELGIKEMQRVYHDKGA